MSLLTGLRLTTAREAPGATKNCLRNPVMLREVHVQEGVIRVENVNDRAVILKQVSEETNRLLIHRAAQGSEGWEMPLALLPHLIKVVDMQPCSGELSCQASRARVAKHTAHLRGEHAGIMELATGCNRAQFRIRGR